MSELKIKNNLDYLTKNEIVDFYELFFGSILIKKPNFPYYTNLTRCIEKENFIKTVVDKLNDIEQTILKLLSKEVMVSYDFIVEKLNMILNIPNQLISKSITYLLDKKYIFLRDNKTLVAIDIFFPEQREKVDINQETQENINYTSKAMFEINNLINYFISSEIKFSNNYNLYKKDYILLKEIFTSYSMFNEKEFNYITYFFNKTFFRNNEVILLENIKEYFNLSLVERSSYFVKEVFPWIYQFIIYFRKLKNNVRIKSEDFKTLWVSSLLLCEINFIPIKTDFDESINLLEKLGIVRREEQDLIFIYYTDEEIKLKDEVKLSSSFNFYINADSLRNDLYLPALFANLKKYNKIVEYEVTETSIQRCIFNGITLETILSFLNNLNIKISKNVETVVTQWFDKYDSYYYCSGTLFFCNSPEKGKLINTMIKKGLIKASQIKKDEVYLIKEEDKSDFFETLNKANICFYNKKPKELHNKIEEKIIDVSVFF